MCKIFICIEEKNHVCIIKLRVWVQIMTIKIARFLIKKSYHTVPSPTTTLVQRYLTCSRVYSKCQLISKCLFGVFNFPKNEQEQINLRNHRIEVKSNFFVCILGLLRKSKRHFEIKWTFYVLFDGFSTVFERAGQNPDGCHATVYTVKSRAEARLD